MKNVSKNGKMRGIFLVSLFTICTVAVIWRRFGTSNTSNPEQQSVRDSLYQQKRVLQYNAKVYSQAVRLAEEGDILFRLDTTSDLSTNSSKQINFNRAGFISREHDTVFVYQAVSFHPGFRGHIIRVPLWNFGHPSTNTKLALYRILPDSVSQNKLQDIVRQQYQQRLLPDSVWLFAGRDGVPDAAFIAFNIEKATGGSIRFTRTADSIRPYVGQKDITSNSRIKEIKHWAY